jgi:uncharacterized protein (TIRG00374 family)
VAAVTFIERALDMLAMAALACLSAVTLVYQEAIVLLLMTSVVVAGGLLLILNTEVKPPQMPLVLGKAFRRVWCAIESTCKHARVILNARRLALGFFLGVAAWALEGFGVFLLGKIASPANLEISAAIGIYAVGILVGALSFMPGGLGGAEAAMTALLAAQGYSVSDALLIALTCRAVTLWFGVCLGWVAILWLRFQSKWRGVSGGVEG